MASTYSSNLKIELMGTGENSGTWGTITNTNLGTAMEQAVIGYGNPDYTSDANLTISITNSNASQAARCLVLNVTSVFGSLTTTRELIVPTSQKQYIVQNNTTGGQSITVKTSGGTGITVTNGRKAHLYVDGTNVIQMFDFVDINGGAIDGTPIGASSASTGAFTTLTSNGATTFTAGTASTTTGTGTLVITGGLGVSGRINAANFDGIIGANTAAAGSFTTLSATGVATFAAGSAAAPAITTTGDTNTGIFFPAADTIAFAEGGVESMRIDASGNLGLGVTPSAWTSGFKAVQIGANGSFYADGTGTYWNNNWYINSSLQSKYLTTNTAQSYEQANGKHAWYIAPSGTAGDTITFTQAMTLDASGNLGIGTSSPSTKLTVYDATSPQLTFNNGTSTFIVGNSAGGNNHILYGTGAYPLIFYTNATEGMRIDSSGNLLVGQTSGSYKLSVTGTVYLDSRVSTGYGSPAAATLGVFGSSNDDAVNSGAVYNMEWTISGNAGGQYWYSNYITRNGSRTLGAYCTGTAWTNASDIVNKEDIVSIGYGLETVMASNPVDFRWKTMKDEDGLGKKDIGFIAQEMELIVPEVVTGNEGQKGISYGSLVAVAFRAIQEQQALITTLTARITALEGA